MALVDIGFIAQQFLALNNTWQHMAFVNALNAYQKLPDSLFVILYNVHELL